MVALMLARQLFTFVTAPPVAIPDGEFAAVAGTKNESERTLRSATEARKTGRTSDSKDDGICSSAKSVSYGSDDLF